MDYIIDNMKSNDWKDIKEIYIEGIKTGNSTFETDAPTWEKWDSGHTKSCRLVARDGEKVIGWAALSPVSGRCVYNGVAEVSVYVGANYRGKGIGKTLLNKLVELSEENGFWTLQAGIFVENKSSLELHKKCGFREIGVREKIGKMKNGDWRDVALLERRSKKIGLD
ncbi:phosphinothricin acetyltransferase [Orenia metallireducens]|uniref:Phosphinothricin acetyltransferase n=1 Tax=Orenia metallireducens TaxID=1413210 RepID=A0A285HMG9_9FIRM|nr:GNAT family N-acetyltransferase [Orenia metallireducens]PRX26958.1 phosphinothricin acetyltransferase [Orenia metallireducens]SNY36938.1 phosphinothricin acetyltransferase [Orenia metallireducens]